MKSCSLLLRPSHPGICRLLVSQATNAGVRRPGCEARNHVATCLICRGYIQSNDSNCDMLVYRNCKVSVSVPSSQIFNPEYQCWNHFLKSNIGVSLVCSRGRVYIMSSSSLSGEKVEDVFIETAEEIYQNIQDWK